MHLHVCLCTGTKGARHVHHTHTHKTNIFNAWWKASQENGPEVDTISGIEDQADGLEHSYNNKGK